MRVLTRDLGDRESVCIIPISDTHIGDPNFREDKLEETLKLAKTLDAYLLLVGDILTADIKDSVGNVYTNKLNPQEQLDAAIKIFQPYADRIIGSVAGNHCLRIYREVGIDVAKILAVSLNPDIYLGVAGIVDIAVGKDKHGRRVGYTFYLTHGWAGGRKAGNKLDATRELRNVVNNADVYLTAHSHLQYVHSSKVETYDVRTKKVYEVEQMFVGTGTYKDYGEYEERKGFPRLKLGSPYIFLNGRYKSIKVILSTSQP